MERKPFSRAELFALFDAHGIDHVTTEHAPVFHVGEGEAIKATMPGGHTKNLFLKDAKGQLWLISALAETVIDLKRAPVAIGSARLSFASPERMQAALGVRPGSVTAFALVNDPDEQVRFVLDAALMRCDPLNFHPLSNDATTAISRKGLMRLLKVLGREPQVVDFAAL